MSTSSSRGSTPGQRSRESLYEEIRTLQLERDLGRVDEAEYLERFHTLRLQAAATLRDEEGRGNDLDRALEEEVARARSGGGELDAGSSCRSCGWPLEAGAEECPGCGTYHASRTPDPPHRDSDESGHA